MRRKDEDAPEEVPENIMEQIEPGGEAPADRLKRLKQRNVASTVACFLKENSSELRRWALWVLVELDDRSVIPQLRDSLGTLRGDNRRMAAVMLGEWKETEE